MASTPSLLSDPFGVFLCLLGCCVFPLADSASPRYTSIISFGDSLADTGNFLTSEVNTFPFVGGPPYGMTYFGRPTGRFCDGRLVVDFIGLLPVIHPPAKALNFLLHAAAEAFGLPKLPPYLGGPGQDFRQGVNFAVAGATALDATFFQKRGVTMWTNYSLSVQLRWFEDLKPSLCRSPQECIDYFRTSLFLVGEIGGNDYNFPFSFRKSMDEVTSYVPLVVEAIASATERLIQQGAVELLVPGNLAIGCSPIYLTVQGGANQADYDPRNGCLKRFNSFSEYHNALLQRALDVLRSKYPTARIMYGDYYEPSIRFANSPKAFGFTNGALAACCGGGGPYNFNTSAICGETGSSVRADPRTFANWDGAHMTEAAYRGLAAALIDQLRAPSPPINY